MICRAFQRTEGTRVECPRCKTVQFEKAAEDKLAWQCNSCKVVWETTAAGLTRHHILAQISTTWFDHEGALGGPNSGISHRRVIPILDKPKSS